MENACTAHFRTKSSQPSCCSIEMFSGGGRTRPGVSRRNGWGWPPHPLQVTSILVKVFVLTMGIGLMAEAFDSIVVRIVIYVIVASLILITTVAMVIVTSIDPADDEIRESIRKSERPTFDRSKHDHVISSNHYCNICEGLVSPTSKHCRQCNKCISDFDHHCKWLNNCVGSRNYKHFLFYVVSITLGSLILIIISVIIWIFFFVDKSHLRFLDEQPLVFEQPVSLLLWLCLLAVTTIFCMVSFGLTFHLLTFHVKLLKNGLTTYGYIMERRESYKHSTSHRREASASKPANNGWLGNVKNKIGAAKQPTPTPPHSHSNVTVKRHSIAATPSDHANGVVRSNGVDQTSSVSTVELDRLPQIHTQVHPNQPVIDTRTESTNTVLTESDVLHELQQSGSGTQVTVHVEPSAKSQSAVVTLPPITDATAEQTKNTNLSTLKIYEPQFESVIGATGNEMFLPAILVKAPSIQSGDSEVLVTERESATQTDNTNATKT